MKAKSKLNGSMLAFVFAIAAAVLIFISLPLVSYAQTGTLGQESPEIHCTYAQNGEVVDGNALTAGTYDVSFIMTGAQSLSVMEITATYDQEQVTVATEPSYLVSDGDAAALDSMGYILSDGNIVFGFVSTNDDCTALAEGENVIATVQMTFASDCDAADYVAVSQNPNLTFVQADYGDGYDDAYALVEQDPEYTQGTLYLMSCNVTPALINSYNVCGQILIATDVTGTNTTAGVQGITVTVTADEAVVAEAVTDADGNYTLADVPVGTYTMTISGSTTIDRTVTLEVTDAKAEGSAVSVSGVGVVICDYNRDGNVNPVDLASFGVALSGDYNVYCDFNADGNINAADLGIFGGFLSKTIEYSEVTL